MEVTPSLIKEACKDCSKKPAKATIVNVCFSCGKVSAYPSFFYKESNAIFFPLVSMQRLFKYDGILKVLA